MDINSLHKIIENQLEQIEILKRTNKALYTKIDALNDKLDLYIYKVKQFNNDFDQQSTQ